MKLLITSTSMLTNRMLSPSFFEELLDLDITLWTLRKPFFAPPHVTNEAFPPINNNPEWVNVLRRINEYAWAQRKGLHSILSMKKFALQFNKRRRMESIVWRLGNLVARLHLHLLSDRLVRFLVCRQNRSEEARRRLIRLAPDFLLITNTFWVNEAAIAVEAKKLGIPVIAMVPSWDNITTKSRITFDPVAYTVWSEFQKKQLLDTYPLARNKTILTTGTPQYDCFFDPRFVSSRDEFCNRSGLDPNRKLIVYALGSPNFIRSEYEGARRFVERFTRNPDFHDCQLLIRPHPNKDNDELQHLHDPTRHVHVQATSDSGRPTEHRNLESLDFLLWVNTFRHADVVINLASSVILDTIALGRPVINIAFDPGKDGLYRDFVQEINTRWTHLQPVHHCRGIPHVQSFEEMEQACLRLLRKPDEAKIEREKLFTLICGPLNPENGKTFACGLKKIILPAKSTRPAQPPQEKASTTVTAQTPSGS